VTRNGHRLGPDGLRITARQALEAHTINAARALGREDDLGSLSPGKRADFAVLAADPLATDPELISQVPVQQTWVDGVRRFAADPAPSTTTKEAQHV